MPAVNPEMAVEFNVKTAVPAATIPVKDSRSELLDESVTLIATAYAAFAELTPMVPEIIPVVVFKVKPVGRYPLEIAKVRGGTPPAVVMPVVTAPTPIPGSEVERIVIAAAEFAITEPE